MKLALVTGASSGLGLELCGLLAQKGYTLLVTGRKELPPALEAVTADLARDRSKVIDLIRRHVPELVINNAGFAYYGPALGHSLDILEVNATAAIEISLEAARVLKEQKKEGVILNVSSVASEISMPYMALYGAAKACLTSFSKSFDAEMRPFGIRILVALPGPIETPFAERASRGKFRQESGLKKEYVAKRIWGQIVDKKQFQVIDWKQKVGIWLARLFPRWAEIAIAKSLAKRL